MPEHSGSERQLNGSIKKVGIWFGIAVGFITVVSFWRGVPTREDMNRIDDNIRSDINNIRRDMDNIRSDMDSIRGDIRELREDYKRLQTAIDTKVDAASSEIRTEVNEGFADMKSLIHALRDELKEIKTEVRINRQNHLDHLAQHEKE